MNRYRALLDKQQAEINAFPFGFAFNDEQYTEMMREWGLCHGMDGSPTEEDRKQIESIGVCGYVRKTDIAAMHDMFARHSQEIQGQIMVDADGNGFIFEMFLDEMSEHEYRYTKDPSDTLKACHLTMEQVEANPALISGWKKAEKEIMTTGQDYAD